MSEHNIRFTRDRAVALQYGQGDQAPRVVAAGAGEIAKRIIELAQEHKVPIHRDDSLVDVLSKLNLGYQIPPETYRAVAEILAFLYRTDIAWRKKKEAQDPDFGKPRTKRLESAGERAAVSDSAGATEQPAEIRQK